MARSEPNYTGVDPCRCTRSVEVSQRQRHDLLRTDWLQTLQRTRSLSSKCVLLNCSLTVHTGVRQLQFVRYKRCHWNTLAQNNFARSVQFMWCERRTWTELNWTENWIELTWTSRPSYRTCSWSRTSASRLHFALTGNRETRSVSARLVLNTCIPMRPFTLSSLTGVQCSSVHAIFIFFTGRFFDKFAVKWSLIHLAYVATLTCETFLPENKRLTINYKIV